MMSRRAPSCVVLWFVVLLDTLALYLVLAVIQDRMTGFFNTADPGDQCIGADKGSAACTHAMSRTALVNGYIAAAGAFVAFLLSGLLGSISDVYGRLPLILLVELVSTLTPICLLLLNAYGDVSLWLYMGSRSVTSGFSILGLAFAYAADCTTNEGRATMFGAVLCAFSFGMIGGPLVATFTGLSQPTVFVIAAGCSVAGVLLTVVGLGESLSEDLQHSNRRELVAAWNGKKGVASDNTASSESRIDTLAARLLSPAHTAQLQEPSTSEAVVVVSSGFDAPEISISQSLADESESESTLRQRRRRRRRHATAFRMRLACSNPFRAVLLLGRSRLLLTLGVIVFLLIFVLLGQVSIAYIFLHRRFGMTPREHAIMTIVGGCCGVAVQSIGLRFVLRFLSNRSVLILGLVALGASNVLYGLSYSLMSIFYLVGPVAAVGALAFPAITALKANMLGPDEQGAIQGALGAVRSLGSGMGPLVLNEIMTATTSVHLMTGTAFYVGTALCAIGVVLACTVQPIEYSPPLLAQDEEAASNDQYHVGAHLKRHASPPAQEDDSIDDEDDEEESLAHLAPLASPELLVTS